MFLCFCIAGRLLNGQKSNDPSVISELTWASQWGSEAWETGDSDAYGNGPSLPSDRLQGNSAVVVCFILFLPWPLPVPSTVLLDEFLR